MKPPGQDPFANIRHQQEQQRRMQEQQQRMREQQQQMQQQQLKQMQDQQRRMQMGAAWTAQQQAKQANQAVSGQLEPRFAQVEAEVASLRGSLASGRINTDQAQAELQNLMIQDDQGSLWTVGFETGDWYRYNGQAWEKRIPPGVKLAAASPYPAGGAVARRKSRPFAGIAALLLGSILTLIAGVAAIVFVERYLNMYGPYNSYAAYIVWALGLLFTLRWSARVWRGGWGLTKSS